MNPTDSLVPALAFHPTPARKLADSDLPPAIRAAGHDSAFACEEFLFGQIRNSHTRRAYTHASSESRSPIPPPVLILRRG